jgi:hypothetical protein
VELAEDLLLESRREERQRIDVERHLEVHHEVVTSTVQSGGARELAGSARTLYATTPAPTENFPVYKRARISYY